MRSKFGNPELFFVYFLSFSNDNTFFLQINVKSHHFVSIGGIQTQDYFFISILT